MEKWASRSSVGHTRPILGLEGQATLLRLPRLPNPAKRKGKNRDFRCSGHRGSLQSPSFFFYIREGKGNHNGRILSVYPRALGAKIATAQGQRAREAPEEFPFASSLTSPRFPLFEESLRVSGYAYGTRTVRRPDIASFRWKEVNNPGAVCHHALFSRPPKLTFSHGFSGVGFTSRTFPSHSTPSICVINATLTPLPWLTRQPKNSANRQRRSWPTRLRSNL